MSLTLKRWPISLRNEIGVRRVGVGPCQADADGHALQIGVKVVQRERGNALPQLLAGRRRQVDRRLDQHDHELFAAVAADHIAAPAGIP